MLEERIGDKDFLKLIKKSLKTEVIESGEYQDTESGVPQGGILSPALNDIFALWEQYNKYFGKYPLPIPKN